MLRDLCSEALSAVLSRPQRAALTVLGTTLGIGALVATAGLATTAGAQIVSRFDELAATQVEVVPADTGDTGPQPASLLPWDAQVRLARLNGVVAAGTLSKLDLSDTTVRTAEVLDPLAAEGPAVEVMAASPGLLGAIRGVVGSGRWFDAGHSARADRVAVLGRNLAAQLNLADVSQQPAVFVAGQPYTVIGVLANVERKPSLLDAVILPDGVARTALGLPAPTSVQIETRIGAADLIASQAAPALAPQDPGALAVRQQPEPTATRAKVAGDVTALFLVLGALSLVIGAVGIANTTLVSVLERTGEIGLRRSIGATRAQVAVQFLLESGCIGLLGGVLGSSLGTMATVGVAYLNTWTPVQDAWLAPGATGLGALVGLAAGAYPAWRAAGTAPIAALRADG
jgi:ABC-type antimicrobial peptide transport system permease subunit